MGWSAARKLRRGRRQRARRSWPSSCSARPRRSTCAAASRRPAPAAAAVHALIRAHVPPMDVDRDVDARRSRPSGRCCRSSPRPAQSVTGPLGRRGYGRLMQGSRPRPRAPRPARVRPAAGVPRARCGCCRTTSTRRSPSAPTTWSSTAAPAGPRGTGASFDAIVDSLRTMAPDDTLLVQSGKPVGIVRTTEQAPRVLIANSLLVPKWATPEHFRELEDAGLTMYGQMTAGSWIYIGTQGILQGTYATFAEVADQHFGGTLAGTLDADRRARRDGRRAAARGDRQRRRGALRRGRPGAGPAPADRRLPRRDRRLAGRGPASWCGRPSGSGGRCRSRVIGNAAEVFPQLRATCPDIDIVTDQTSAHDALNGYVPAGLTLADALELRRAKPEEYVRRATESMAEHCAAMVAFARAGAGRLRLRQRAARAGPGRRAGGRVLLSRASCSPTSGRCSPAAPGRSAGPACPATRPTWPRPTRPCSTRSRTTTGCTGGSGSPRSG